MCRHFNEIFQQGVSLTVPGLFYVGLFGQPSHANQKWGKAEQALHPIWCHISRLFCQLPPILAGCVAQQPSQVVQSLGDLLDTESN